MTTAVSPGASVDDTAITRAIATGRLVADRVFDELFPPFARRASSIHWTPVEVAVRAAKMLAAVDETIPRDRDATERKRTIIDVGAGVGKFCMVAAAALPGVRVVGVEQRARFVEIAREAATRIGVDVEFVQGTLRDVDPAEVDGLYLFNPFAENLSAPHERLDETVELSEERFKRDIAIAEEFMSAARRGTRVVVYCGFGGAVPRSYRLVRREPLLGTLELWTKEGGGQTP